MPLELKSAVPVCHKWLRSGQPCGLIIVLFATACSGGGSSGATSMVLRARKGTPVPSVQPLKPTATYKPYPAGITRPILTPAPLIANPDQLVQNIPARGLDDGHDAGAPAAEPTTITIMVPAPAPPDPKTYLGANFDPPEVIAGTKDDVDFDAPEVVAGTKQDHDFDAPEVVAGAKQNRDFDAPEVVAGAKQDHDFDAPEVVAGRPDDINYDPPAHIAGGQQ